MPTIAPRRIPCFDSNKRKLPLVRGVLIAWNVIPLTLAYLLWRPGLSADWAVAIGSAWGMLLLCGLVASLLSLVFLVRSCLTPNETWKGRLGWLGVLLVDVLSLALTAGFSPTV